MFPGLTRKTIRQAPAPTLPLYLLSLSFSPCVPNPLAVGVGQVGDQGLQRLNSESDNSTRRCSLSRHPPANSLPRDKSEKVKHLIHSATPIPTDAIYLKSYNLNQGLFWNIQSASLFFSNILKGVHSLKLNTKAIKPLKRKNKEIQMHGEWEKRHLKVARCMRSTFTIIILLLNSGGAPALNIHLAKYFPKPC